jgi:signal transduction histidine kinase
VLPRLSLRARLVALVAVGAIVATTLAALALYRNISGEVSRVITSELRVRMEDLHTDLDDPSAALEQRPIVEQIVDQSNVPQYPRGAVPILTKDELNQAANGELLIDRHVNGIGDEARVFARPIESSTGGSLIGVTAASTSPLEHVRDRLLLVLLVASPVLTAAVTFAAWLLAGAALRPVRRMARRAETISLTNPGERLPEPEGTDEIAELGHTLNAMLDRIESTVRHERAFVDDASHELRAPLAVLRGELELALDENDLYAIKRGVASSLEETDRLVRLASDLLTLARVDAGATPNTVATCDLTETAREAVRRLSISDGVMINIEGTEAFVPGPEEWVEEIVSNLVSNASDYARSRVDVTVSRDDATYRLTVSDDGPGFPQDLLPRAFERFARGDSSRGRGGTGLGLAIVHAVAQALGGQVDAHNGPPLGGATVDVTLPAVNGTEPSHGALIVETPRSEV